MTKKNINKILSRGDTVSGKQVQNDKVRDCRTTFAMTEQRGRSMVEMLGVLAVIGVLSVAGIAGYTSAMRSYRANEIVNAASMLFMLGLAQNAGEGTGTLEYSSVAGQLPSGCGGITYKGDKATLDVNITDEDVCNQVKVKLGDKAGTCTVATSPATGYTLTVTLGDATNPVYDYDKWEKGDCEDGYVFVNAPNNGCARTLEEATQYCLTFSGFGVTGASVALRPSNYAPGIDPPWKDYFKCD